MADSDSTYFLVYVGSTNQNTFAKISPQDAEIVLRYRWHITTTRRGRYQTTRYAFTDIGPKASRERIKMHRLIMNAPEGMHVDHINGDGLDNRRENLRIVTPEQNQANSRKHIHGTSRFKGVCWSKPSNRWRAYIAAGRKQEHIGLFDTELEAAAAYDKRAKEVWGAHAYLNLS